MYDYGFVERIIKRNLREYVKNSGHSGVVVGVSGGVDSAVCATLAVKALGKKNVAGAIMPVGKIALKDVSDAVELCMGLGIEHYLIDIGGIVDLIVDSVDSVRKKKCSKIEKGNIAARIRMVFLYGLASDRKSLVLGTGNKSELLLGYFTKHGDGGVDLLPLGDLYKGEVYDLAKHVGVPKKILAKKPSPNLWEKQTDEGDLGFAYSFADSVLGMFLERNMDGNEIVKHLGKRKTVKKIYGMVKSSSHKRNPPRILSMKLGLWQ